MKKSHFIIYIVALICMLVAASMVACTQPDGTENTENGESVTTSAVEQKTEHNNADGGEKTEDGGDEVTEAVTGGETESETETETKNYGMGFVPL